jgi:hypothetical protein
MFTNTSYKLSAAKNYWKILTMLPPSFVQIIKTRGVLKPQLQLSVILDRLLITEPIMVIRIFPKQNECQSETLQPNQMDLKSISLELSSQFSADADPCDFCTLDCISSHNIILTERFLQMLKYQSDVIWESKTLTNFWAS